MSGPPEQIVFYYDLGDPECYLAAERAVAALGGGAEWEPVLAAAGFAAPGEPDLAALAGRAQSLGCQPLRWPRGWPPDTRDAMLAATYAKQIGRTIAFSLAAFRQAFAGGRDLGQLDTVLIAGAACEIHPAALIKATRLRSVTDGLEAAVARARRAGVDRLPAVAVGAEVFAGADAIEAAARAVSEAA